MEWTEMGCFGNAVSDSVNTDNMNELALRLLIFYTQIPVRDKTTIEWFVCVVVSVLF
jgi:hypothetical protein